MNAQGLQYNSLNACADWSVLPSVHCELFQATAQDLLSDPETKKNLN